MINVNYIKKSGAREPEYKSDGSAGADLFAFLDSPVIMKPGCTALIPTGVSIELPPGYEAQIRPRSGLALEHGISILNSPGTIDSDYRGEIKIILTNFGSSEFVIENDMRIAQIIFARVYKGKFISVNDLNNTQRGKGGFGHTGL